MVACYWNNSGIPQIITFLSPEESLYGKTSKIFEVFPKQKSEHFKKTMRAFIVHLFSFAFLMI